MIRGNVRSVVRSGPVSGTGERPDALYAGAALALDFTTPRYRVGSSATTDFTQIGSFPGTETGLDGANGLRVADSDDYGLITDLSWLNASAGTILLRMKPRIVNPAANAFYVTLDDGTTSNTMFLHLVTSDASHRVQVTTGGVAQAVLNLGLGVAEQVATFAFAYSANDFAGSLNGAAVVTDAAGTIPTVTRMVIGNRSAADRPMDGWIEQVVYWPTRKSNAELVALSS